MSFRPTLKELNLKFMKFSCKDFEGNVSFIWANQEVEYKYYNYELAPIVEQTLKLIKPPKLYRGTTIDRLSYALKNGSTSEKPKQGFWGNMSLDKAMEYGHLILCYDLFKCKSSHKTFDLENLSKKELIELRAKYNSEEISQDKKKIFFSMFSPERRGLVHYERDHGYFIPIDEKEALQDILIFGGGPKEEDLMKALENFNKCGGSLQLDGKELFTQNEFL